MEGVQRTLFDAGATFGGMPLDPPSVAKVPHEKGLISCDRREIDRLFLNSIPIEYEKHYTYIEIFSKKLWCRLRS